MIGVKSSGWALLVGIAAAVLATASVGRSQTTPVFTYYGDALQVDGVTPMPDNIYEVVVVVDDSVCCDTLRATVGETETGTWAVTVIDWADNRAVAAGAQVEATLLNEFKIGIASLAIVLTTTDIQAASRRIDLIANWPVSVPVPSYPLLLRQNVPNPTRGGTTITFHLPRRLPVSLEVFDVRGRRVRTLLHRAMLDAGPHQAVWWGLDGNDRPVRSGVFFYRLTAGGVELTRRLTLIR